MKPPPSVRGVYTARAFLHRLGHVPTFKQATLKECAIRPGSSLEGTETWVLVVLPIRASALILRGCEIRLGQVCTCNAAYIVRAGLQP